MRRLAPVILALVLMLCALMPRIVLAASHSPTPPPAPTATQTAQPSATPQPKQGRVSIAPNPLTLTEGSTTEGIPNIVVTVSGLDPHEDIAVYMQDKGDVGQVTVAQGTTDAGGNYHASVQDPVSGAGTYAVLVYRRIFLGATDRTVIAQGAFTLKTVPPQPVVDTSSPNWYAGIWSNAIHGLVQWYAAFTNDGRENLLQAVWTAVLAQPDLTESKYDDITAFAAPFVTWSAIAIDTLFGLRFLSELRTAAKRRRGDKIQDALIEILVLGAVIGGLKLYEHQAWQAFASYAHQLAQGGIHSFSATLKRYATIPKGTLDGDASWTLGLGVAGFDLLIMTAQFLLIEVTKLGGMGLLVFLYLVGVLCLPFFVIEHTRGLALWWLRSILAISSWCVLYAFLLSGEGTIASTLFDGMPSLVSDLTTSAGAAIGLLVGIDGVPLIAAFWWTAIIIGAGGIISMGLATGPAQKLKRRLPIINRF